MYLTVLENNHLSSLCNAESAIHVLETLHEVFFGDEIQKPRHVSLISEISSNLFSFNKNLSSENRKKSRGLRSGEDGGCSICISSFFQVLFDDIDSEGEHCREQKSLELCCAYWSGN
ncbi:hypothetical protein TNCV_2307621 [Trichonephila clavipes]|nr:hypothetical protein TNCV_2307621 [Trichonephila clavipes]